MFPFDRGDVEAVGEQHVIPKQPVGLEHFDLADSLNLGFSACAVHRDGEALFSGKPPFLPIDLGRRPGRAADCDADGQQVFG